MCGDWVILKRGKLPYSPTYKPHPFFRTKFIFSWCRRNKANVIFLQETHSTSENANKWENEWGGKIVFSHGKSNARGVCILFRKGLDVTVLNQATDNCGRLIYFVEY